MKTTYSIVINSKDELIKFLGICTHKGIKVDIGKAFWYADNNQFGLRFIKQGKNLVKFWDSDAGIGGRKSHGYIDYSLEDIEQFHSIVEKGERWNDLEIGDVFQWAETKGYDYVKLSDHSYANVDCDLFCRKCINDHFEGMRNNHLVILKNKKVKFSLI